MKVSLLHLVAIVCLLTVGAVMVGPIRFAGADRYMSEIKIYVAHLSHSGGVVSQHTVKSDETWTNHESTGSHQHEVTVNIIRMGLYTCPVQSPSQCTYCE